MKLEPNTAQKPKSCPFVLSFAELHKSKCQNNIYFAIDAFEHSMNIDYQSILLHGVALVFTTCCYALKMNNIFKILDAS